jgi:hypothetical protein
MASPVTDIILPSTIKQTWGPGAEILVTSQSLSWDQQETRIIQTVDDYDSSSIVIKLDSAISMPLTYLDGDFPVEVALLSRNIVVDSGHLTVYRTPTVPQIITGVQFRNVQVPEEVSRHPAGFISFLLLLLSFDDNLIAFTPMHSAIISSRSDSSNQKVSRGRT